MIAHPPVLALVLASTLSALVMVPTFVFALRLLARWDPSSGNEEQLKLEKTTYLVSTLVAFVAVVELASLAAFAFNADRMAVLFVGAMCAVGTLNASSYGFPTLVAKIAVFFAAFVWLVLDRTDNKGRDYPFILQKYWGILLLALLVVLDAALQLAYFLDLKASTITSCCGKLFGDAGLGAGAELAGIEPRLALVLLFGGLAITIALSFGTARSRLMGRLLGLASPAMFAIAIAGVISVISVHVYEQPHHHCPFCLLKREYGFFGFLLYIPLFAATGSGMAAGLLSALPARQSLSDVLPPLLGRLSILTISGFALFGGLSLWKIMASRLTLM
ncbi:MAG: hypothetical protein HY852_17020 [Bradyrhizobium sp.]|uniref:hypothetical protein n=1 Tax=Bradyrhizobium sp. TaxID=376 RepID=UPI0025C73295|nr:hypothetical protein [Bradyrhizobium sp.]MBI5263514.1 hypothetical protein [Bradyrhizobium sp.]